ncbi:endo-1,4-beta-xylanase, partial [bacterium]|nr:endo-1,4-beta-xylanase [bacterium]
MGRILSVILVFLLFLVTSYYCDSQSYNVVKVEVNLDSTIQTIHSFGASDAWRCQFVGKNWPLVKRNQMAEWLFSKELDAAGSPKGIGLSMWRFNIGAGSLDQGDSSLIDHPWRKAECFLTYQGNYDWST